MSEYLEVFWANTHNLKNIDVKIPKNKLVVITGVSGSWKSSLAFNTIYSEWKKRYLESLSTYARMFIWGMKEEAEVREIRWLSPTISIDQKTVSHNPRSTVWTITEIYDFYKLMYLHLWERKCVKCWNVVSKDSVDDIIEYIKTFEKWDKFIIKAPILKLEKEITYNKIKSEILNLGFIRYSVWDTIYNVNEECQLKDWDEVNVIIDRLVVKNYWDDETCPELKRIKDSIDIAFRTWDWFISIWFIDFWESKKFSNVFVCSNCWHVPDKLNISSFSFNSHHWACQACQWLWQKMTFLEDDIVSENLTLNEWAINAIWFWGDYIKAILKRVWEKNSFDLDTPYIDLPKKARDIIMHWTWDKEYKIKLDTGWDTREYKVKHEWVINTLLRRYFDSNSEFAKNKMDDMITLLECQECHWHRLNEESLSIYLEWINIWEMSNLPINKALELFKNYKYPESKEKIVRWILKNIIERLDFLNWVWLPYITISRRANTLSGWESQRIRLATQIWTKLEWIIYVLDEPSIWLHPRDNDMLIVNLKKLKEIWNTLIVVEHDEDIMRESDYIIDIWPWAWIHWWNIVCSWTPEEICNNPKSVTWPYLNGSKRIKVDRDPRIIDKKLTIIWASENNLKNVDVELPLWHLISITWVSWSWKSSLVNNILANHLSNSLNRSKKTVWKFKEISWIENLDKTVIIDQSPIWRTPRSNPATYTWLFTTIREVYSLTEEAKIRWFWPGRFSFNTKWWRCEACDWDGAKKVEMHFLPPVYVTCEVCKWKRYKKETLSINYKWKNISDVLNMTIDEASEFFANIPKIIRTINILQDVWLWYIKIWQSSLTLSWWEAQRIKLATELSKRSTWQTMYILDEPTTWLHFQDVEKLLKILHSLVDKWNSVLVIEHNLDVILNSDYIVDIWPEWWDGWWELIYSWDIKWITKVNKSYTWKAIKKYLNNI